MKGAAKSELSCKQAETFVHAYVDGELTGHDRDAYERHIEGCECCRAAGRFEGRFKAAVRAHLPRRQVPAALERRIQAALADLPVLPGRRLWSDPRRLIPVLVVAAGVIVVVGGTLKQRRSFVLEQARRTYQAEVPLDVTGPDCSSVTSWFRGRVDFPVHAPQLAGTFTCQGGRLVNVEDRPAAYLVYQDTNGHRVSVLVFDPAATYMEAPHRRVVKGREIFYRRAPGSLTAGFFDRDIGYAVTAADFDEESLTRMVTANLH